MFTHLLVDSEKEAFLKLLVCLARIDGELTHEESAFIQRCCWELDLELAQIFPQNTSIPLDLHTILEEITTSLSQRVVIVELITMAYADGAYSEREQQGIRTIAEWMDVDTATIPALEEWVRAGRTWTDHGMNLITGGTTNG